MKTRRTHNKTRFGCGDCKRRRIKCDGKHPRCANCEKKGLECSFLLLAPASRLTSTSASPTSTSPLSATSATSSRSTDLATVPKKPYEVQVFRHSPRSSRSPSPRRTPSPAFTLSDFELPPSFSIPKSPEVNDVWKECRSWLAPSLQPVLSHYEYTTSLTMATDDPAKEAWKTFIPEMASNHRYLLHCVLAVASLHLARLHDDKTMKAEMTATAATQMNKALLLYRPALENLNHTNSAALFASSALTAVYFFRTTVIDFEAIFASVPAGTSTPPPVIVDKMIQCVLKIIWGFRGPAAVLRPSPGYEWSLDRRMQHIATRKWWPRKRVPATQRALEEDARLCKIERLWMHPGRDYEEHFKMLARHLSDLRDTFALVSQLTLPSSEFPSMTSIPYSVDDTTDGFLKDRGAVFVWPTLISSEFIDLVVQKNREALVIVAHYAILIGRVRNVWWVEGIGPHLLVAVATALGRENWHLIEWPAQALGVDLENAFGSRRDRLEGKPDEMRMDVI